MKFINLLKKELSELVNMQMILGLVVTLAIFMILGTVMKTSINDAVDESSNVTINISDRDKTDFTESIIEAIKSVNSDQDSSANVTLNIIETEGDNYADILSSNDISNLVIIPKGFTDSIEKTEQPELISISRMTSTATMSNMSTGNSSAISLIESCISSAIASDTGMDEKQYALMESPISVVSNTVVDDRSAQISSDAILNKVMMQNMILPLIVFVLILLTSQMLVSAISNEKIDKTLETLLSAPVSRLAVIGSKMLAAAVIALINAAVYMVGFSVFVGGANDSLSDVADTVAGESITVDAALSQLGLSLNAGSYILVGLQLFFTIMICLSVSLVLGALINDSKNTQNMIMPIMLLAMIPFMISVFTDINTLPMALRIIVYAIPFTHTFSAIPNLMFGNNTIFFIGLVYQIAVFIICIFFALKLFMSDKIFTISLNFGQKSKYKKKNKKFSGNED